MKKTVKVKAYTKAIFVIPENGVIGEITDLLEINGIKKWRPITWKTRLAFWLLNWKIDK
jgi:hypothetical protein